MVSIVATPSTVTKLWLEGNPYLCEVSLPRGGNFFLATERHMPV
jgi:hypothetical protein